MSLLRKFSFFRQRGLRKSFLTSWLKSIGRSIVPAPSASRKADAERFIRRALDAGRMEKRWSESTVRRVSGYLLGCCTDFGLLGEGQSVPTSD